MARFFSRFSKKKNTPAIPESAVAAEFTFAEEEKLNYEKDPFLYSLGILRREDIPLSHPVKKITTGERIAEALRRVMLCISVLVFIGSCAYLIDNFIQKAKASSLYEEAAAEFAAAALQFQQLTSGNADNAETPRPAQNQPETPLPTLTDTINRLYENDTADTSDNGGLRGEIEKLRAVLSTYKERNEDVCSYVSAPAAGIDYVVVQGEDNDFYLNHNYKGEPLVVGSIYMDFRCAEDLTQNYNTILYGHNIEIPGIMFHGVTDFFEEEIFENERIFLYTMDGVFIYKAFSVYETRADSGYIRTEFQTDEDFSAFCRDMQLRSEMENEIDLTGVRSILTLSTCTNRNNGRYALHAYLEGHIQ